MWTKYRKSTIGKVNVAFNKVFKVFMNVTSPFTLLQFTCISFIYIYIIYIYMIYMI